VNSTAQPPAIVSVEGLKGRSNEVDRGMRAGARFAWLTLLLAAGLIGVLIIVVRLVVHGDASAVDWYNIFNLGALVLAIACAFGVVRAAVKGQPWRSPFPPGYGALGAGSAVLVAAALADVGWREGVENPEGFAASLAPTRILIFVGLVLVACGPLRAALGSSDTRVPRWAAVVSAALVLVATLLPAGFHPAANPWLERAPTVVTGEMRVMDGDGSHQTRLILPSGRNAPWNAAWSPDGTRIAFTRMRVGDHSPLDDDAEVWVANADGTDARPVAQGPDWQWIPHWSPDGLWIAYTVEPQGGPWMAAGPGGLESGGGPLGPGFLPGQPSQVRGYADIWRTRADGSGAPERLTTAEGDDRAATYSPDGRKLAFDSTRDGPTHVWVMDADGSKARRMSYGGDDWGATWSPDGKWIAYNSWIPGTPDAQIWVVDADNGASGRGARQVTSGPGQHREPSWSPDGSRIAFTLGTDEQQQIWSVAADGSDPRNLTNDPGGGGELISGGGAWSKNGLIVYTRGSQPPAIADRLVRQDLAAAAMLLTALLAALVAVVLVRIRPPLGAFAALFLISTGVLATISDQWRFVPALLVGGLIVDLLVRLVGERWKVVAAGAGSAAALVLGAEATVALTSGVNWSLTLMAGVASGSVFIGWLVAELAGGPRARIAESAT
jgi:Tol biopolymer transport system component